MTQDPVSISSVIDSSAREFYYVLELGADKFSVSEWETRKTRIEPKLHSAGWDVVPFDSTKSLVSYHSYTIEEYPTSAGPADYALCLNGHIIGVIEVKRLTLGPQNVLT